MNVYKSVSANMRNTYIHKYAQNLKQKQKTSKLIQILPWW